MPGIRWRLRGCATAALLAVLTAAPGPLGAQNLSDLAGAAKSAGRDVFGSTSFGAASLKALPQWRRVVDKVHGQQEVYARCAADAGACGTAALRAWRKILSDTAGRDRREQLKRVNHYFNRWPYKLDIEVYGQSEYWATPVEFMTNSGDCEDYAIAKFFALRHSGFATDELRIVVVWDRIRGIGHAILAVYAQSGVQVLDSLTDFIVSDSKYRHYVPQVSVDETRRWAHVVAGKQLPTRRRSLGKAP